MTATSLFTRLSRVSRLVVWFGKTCWRFRQLDNADLAQRYAILSEAARTGLHILNVNVNIAAHENRPTQGVLLVANHVSWLDIFAIMAHYPSSFIAAKELKSWFLVGKMIENAGTVFINRQNRKDIDPINQAIAQTLQSGGNVCFFPEARTSLGNGVLPLKAALFQAAIAAQSPIQVLALRYYDQQNQRTERVSFSDTNFFVSLWQILSLPEIRLQIDENQLIEPQKLPENDRFALKDLAENYLNEIVLSDSPNPQKLLKDKK